MAHENVEFPDSELGSVDWSTHSLDIGIKRGDGQERWLPLNTDDLKMLSYALRKPLLENGTCIADVSEGLARLANWAEVAREWSAKRGLP